MLLPFMMMTIIITINIIVTAIIDKKSKQHDNVDKDASDDDKDGDTGGFSEHSAYCCYLREETSCWKVLAR